ncbi:MAG: hypothetical protein KME45_26935 [Stenomitos rutilans HA7619-LM2]|nr:hypothetical protein [Stenomitos rutilans HA7619-LM2]
MPAATTWRRKRVLIPALCKPIWNTEYSAYLRYTALSPHPFKGLWDDWGIVMQLSRASLLF